jgi:hypothetical protein
MAKTWLLCAILVTVWLLLCTVQMNFKLEQMINYMVPLVSFVSDWMKLQNPFPKLQMIHSSNDIWLIPLQRFPIQPCFGVKHGCDGNYCTRNYKVV